LAAVVRGVCAARTGSGIDRRAADRTFTPCLASAFYLSYTPVLVDLFVGRSGRTVHHRADGEPSNHSRGLGQSNKQPEVGGVIRNLV